VNPVDHDNILSAARKVLSIEEQSLIELKERLGAEFVSAVKLLLSSKGRVVFAGMGKSGLVCRKIAATFASTGP